MTLLKPKNLDLSKYKSSAKYYYILDRLCIKRYIYKFDSNQYINFNAKVLKTVLGKNYIQIIDDLIRWGIIETDGYYIPGKKSKGYRPTDNFYFVHYETVEIYDQLLIDRIRKHKRKPNNNDEKTYQYLYECLEKISINYDSAFNWISENYETIDQYLSYVGSINAIQNKDWYFTLGANSNRLFHNVNGLKRELRQFLRINGKRLFEVDIANSQPVLLNLLIASLQKDEKYIKYYNLYNNTTFLSYDAPINTPMSFNDVEQYKQDTTSGKFYDILMKEMDYQGDKDSFKVSIFSKIFYNEIIDNYEYKEWTFFKRRYPTVANMITYLKREKYNDLAIHLQQIEAEIMLNNVVPILQSENIYCVTIHDSVMVKKINVEKTKEIIKNVFKSKYDLNVIIKSKG